MKKSFSRFLLAIAFASGMPGAHAGPDPFLGEISWFAGNFAPTGWAFCDGQLLSINQNQSLFSLLGTMYGGDGQTTFALPDVRGRVLVHAGQGPGLSNRSQGEKGGSEAETLTAAQMPAHTHQLKASPGTATSSTPNGNVLAATGRTRIYDDASGVVAMSSSAISTTGSSQAHNNMQPFVTLRCIIATVGTFPSPN